MGWDVGKSLLNNPHIAVTSAAAQIPGPSFPLESQLRRHGGALARGEHAAESRGTSETGGGVRKRRGRGAVQGESSQGRRWERERKRWDAVRREEERVDEGEADEGQACATLPAGDELSPLCPHVNSSRSVPGRQPTAVTCLRLCQAALAGQARYLLCCHGFIKRLCLCGNSHPNGGKGKKQNKTQPFCSSAWQGALTKRFP